MRTGIANDDINLAELTLRVTGWSKKAAGRCTCTSYCAPHTFHMGGDMTMTATPRAERAMSSSLSTVLFKRFNFEYYRLHPDRCQAPCPPPEPGRPGRQHQHRRQSPPCRTRLPQPPATRDEVNQQPGDQGDPSRVRRPR